MEEEEEVRGREVFIEERRGCQAFVIWPTGNDRAGDLGEHAGGSTRGSFGLG